MVRIPHGLIWRVIAASLCFFSVNAYSAINQSGVDVKWGYKGNVGPAYWGKLNPDFILCSTGKMQTPISIPKKVKTVANALAIDYQPAPMIIIEDGTTDLMIGHTQTIIKDGHGVQLNFPAGQSRESITFEEKKYRLVQFHFHSPSETMLRKESFPLEIHFVHQGDDGQLAVIGVLVSDGQVSPNPAIQKIIDHLPADHGKEHVIQGERINPMELLPAKQDYYSFDGSLTTPPCTQGAQWIVMAHTITASSAQIVRLRREMGGANARPVQPLYGRTVSYSMAK